MVVVVVDDVEIDGQKADKQAAANMEQHQHRSWLAVDHAAPNTATAPQHLAEEGVGVVL